MRRLCLVHQRCALQRVTGSFRCEIVTSEFAEFVVSKGRSASRAELSPFFQRTSNCVTVWDEVDDVTEPAPDWMPR